MAVILPTFPAPQTADPYFVDAGGVQRAIAGGEDMRLDRLGDRFGLAVSLIPMRWQGLSTAERVDAARVWVARLVRGLSEGAVLPWPQPGFEPPGNPSVAAGAAGSGASQVEVAQVGGAVTLLEGQFVTHVRAETGRRYIYQVRADTVLPANGSAMVPLWPRIRGPIAPGDVLNFKKPTIEGLVRGDKQGWQIGLNRLSAIGFTIEERG